MKVFISYSFGTDDMIAGALNAAVARRGHEAFDREALARQLNCLSAGGSDRVDLDMAWHQAGYVSSTQERSDPALLEYLIDTVAEQEALVILWSRDYARKFWTRVEWKTALAMCKPLVVIQMDGTPLDRDLGRAVHSGKVPRVQFDPSFRPSNVASLLDGLRNAPVAQCLGEEWDEHAQTCLVKIWHPLLGCFEIGKYEVTNRDLSRWSPERSGQQAPTADSELLPATQITWSQASDICRRLSRVSPGFVFRLPTEVEWECAARAGCLTFSGLPGGTDEYAVLGSKAPMSVGSKTPNAWGLFDMVGNVTEWCLDTGELFEYNGWVQPVEGTDPNRAHMVRGGWFGELWGHRTSVSYPLPQPSEMASEVVGMRLCRTEARVEAHS